MKTQNTMLYRTDTQDDAEVALNCQNIILFSNLNIFHIRKLYQIACTPLRRKVNRIIVYIKTKYALDESKETILVYMARKRKWLERILINHRSIL